ncbi:hypothetical protein SAMD00019534_028390 [Acytostelium subglobosum LB1]|uniref:hypothetical protein n=1 Tax=Acytostelium subglobosum LB1 TaxID=1410327 RepID=UPI000644BFC4|nr:hypothetical protein SAMD00019534_028390 [Acytostelium subglobosum LB1]GAM19664.1 hypothetical protein SAMD00019534_028390 [Acytostelium subglobosum LB1]|eukprot:XP_012756426.1 hypothetical protein SAMD00019534_028390 [Acytostelium subglobosum LB1]
MNIPGSRPKPGALAAPLPPPPLTLPPTSAPLPNANPHQHYHSSPLTTSASHSQPLSTSHQQQPQQQQQQNGPPQKSPPPPPPPRDAKSNTKSTIISNKLKKFFTHRPSRDSLYERHILNAPYNSSNLSYFNVYRVVEALKKADVSNTEGIFRINGNAETIRTLWLSLNTPELNLDISHTTHDLAGLLKLYLRESKFPLIPIELFPNMATPTTVTAIRDFITKLPNENLKILNYLVDFLHQHIISNSPTNKMNSVALAVCFAPNLIRSIQPNSQTADSFQQIQNHCNMVAAMLDNKDFIFQSDKSTAGGEDMGGMVGLPLPPSPSGYSSSPVDQYINELPPPPPPVIIDNTVDSSPISPLFDELTNLLIEDISQGNKDVIIGRMTSLFLTDPDNFKSFLKEILGVDGLVSLLELILTME